MRQFVSKDSLISIKSSRRTFNHSSIFSFSTAFKAKYRENWQRSSVAKKKARRRTWKMTNSSLTLSRPNKISCCTQWVILKILIPNLFARLTFNGGKSTERKNEKLFPPLNRWKSCLINQKCFSIIFLHNKADLNRRKEEKILQ